MRGTNPHTCALARRGSLASLIAFAFLAIAPPAWACPDPQLAAERDITATGAALATPDGSRMSLGGTENLAKCLSDVSGFIRSAPSIRLTLTETAGSRDLIVVMDSGCRPVVLVRDPAGEFHFTETAPEEYESRVSIRHAADGVYTIWFGTRNRELCGGRAWVRTSGLYSADPEPEPEPEPAPAPPPTPAPPPAAPAQPLTLAAEPDPGTLDDFGGRTNRLYTFEVTGAASGTIWGTDRYTTDSLLARAAVHAGLLHVGQTGPVTVRMSRSDRDFIGSERNGVISAFYPDWHRSFVFESSFIFGGGVEANNVYADPGSLATLRGYEGETLTFQVTGAEGGMVWGTDVYTDDSSLARAVVHAGLLAPGQTGQVRVTLLPGQDGYRGSARNGVQSQDWGAWVGSFRLTPGG